MPLIYLAVRALSAGPAEIVDVLWRQRTLVLLARSVGLAAVVTTVSVVVGVGWAWLVTRSALPGRRVWLVVGVLPLAVPSYLAAYAWVSMLPTLPPFLGSVLVLSLVCFPYVLLPVAAALTRADPAAEDVARSLGRGPAAVLMTVTLRQVRPAVASGALLVALYVLADFGAVATLRLDTFTRVIYTSYRAGFDPLPAALLSLVLVAVTGVVAGAEIRSRGRARQAMVGAGVARKRVRVELSRPTRAVAPAVLAGVSVLALGVPLGSVAFWLAGASRGVDIADLASATTATAGLAAATAVATTVLAAPLGFLTARHPSPTVHRLERVSYLGYALPGIVVGLALVYLGVRVVYPLYQTTTMLILAYVVLFLPIAVGSVRSAVSSASPALEEVARSLGHSPARTLVRVTAPLAAPGVLAGAALVAVTVMKELPATLILSPTGTTTLATSLWSATSAGAYAAAAPYAAALVIVAIVPAGLLAARRETIA